MILCFPNVLNRHIVPSIYQLAFAGLNTNDLASRCRVRLSIG